MLKRLLLISFICLIYVSSFVSADATSGTIKQNSVIECDGKYYGSHGIPKHWHVVIRSGDKWISSSNEVTEPSCYADIENVKEEVVFNKCVDGDTAKVIINDDIKTVRFLAIDTPESVHPDKEVEEFGKEASDYTCNLLTNAKKIYLEYDKNSDKEDKYGRLLAYVYVDDLMVQEELIKVGYAKVAYLYADYTYTNSLQELESVAKSNKVGLWKDESGEIVPKKKKKSLIDSIFDFISKIIDNIFEFIKEML